MKFALPKNRIAPLILFAILSILISLLLSLFHMNRMAEYSYKSQLETYAELTENAAALLKQEIESNYKSLRVTANLVAKAGELDKSTISTILPLVAEDSSYLDIAIVGIDGKGFNLKQESVDVSMMDYFPRALNGYANTSDSISYINNKPVITLATPIIDNGNVEGVLLAIKSAEIDNLALMNNEVIDGSQIYLINENNQLISYVKGTDVSDFNYNSIVKKEHFYSKNQIVKNDMNISEFFIKENQTENSMVWQQLPLGINHWSILIGKNYVINPTTKEILRITNLMWVIIMISTFFLFILMIVIQRRSNKKVIQMLYLDPVTGGDNWYKFRINVSKILSSKQFYKRRYALINFDINRFKIINDAYGYQKGDEVLNDIYQVIKRWSRPSEPFTRYAADQFYILISLNNEEELIKRINDLNDRLHQLRYTKTARIFYGVYYITERQDSIDRMGEFAGIAKSSIKGNTESNISFFDDVARGRLLVEEEIEKSMNEALKNDEFQVYLQPKYLTREETIAGAEALVRWKSNSGTTYSPGNFIPVFEKNGFITELDYYMLRKVCKLIKGWLDKGLTPLPISVNISRLHFANPHLADIISEMVDNYGVPHNLIELEITESAFLQNKKSLIEAVIKLREHGFLISMDDFGAGYSSLNSLKDLPLDVVKLDGELFRLTDEVERGLTVIRNTITMAKDLHMKVVAECIETREQVEFLGSVGCDIIQGYYFAKPMPVDQFEQRYFSFIEID